MTPAETELAHLMALLDPPYTQGWAIYCEKKAEGLARKHPQDYAALPEMLKAAMVSASDSASTASRASPPKASGPQSKAKP